MVFQRVSQAFFLFHTGEVTPAGAFHGVSQASGRNQGGNRAGDAVVTVAGGGKERDSGRSRRRSVDTQWRERTGESGGI